MRAVRLDLQEVDGVPVRGVGEVAGYHPKPTLPMPSPEAMSLAHTPYAPSKATRKPLPMPLCAPL